MNAISGTWCLKYNCTDPASSVPRLMDHLRKRRVPIASLHCEAESSMASVSLTVGPIARHEADHLLNVAKLLNSVREPNLEQSC